MPDDPTPPDEALGPDRAVLDRIVDGETAVLLVGPAGDELTVPAASLPEDTADGTWFVLDLDADPPTVSHVDHDLTRERRSDSSDRLSRIRRSRRGGRFDRPDGDT